MSMMTIVMAIVILMTLNMGINKDNDLGICSHDGFKKYRNYG